MRAIKAALKKLLRLSHPGIVFNKHFDVEGTVVFHHACKLGCEGIVSKRLGSPYRFGRSDDWLKVKNPKELRPEARRSVFMNQYIVDNAEQTSSAGRPGAFGAFCSRTRCR